MRNRAINVFSEGTRPGGPRLGLARGRASGRPARMAVRGDRVAACGSWRPASCSWSVGSSTITSRRSRRPRRVYESVPSLDGRIYGERRPRPRRGRRAGQHPRSLPLARGSSRPHVGSSSRPSRSCRGSSAATARASKPRNAASSARRDAMWKRLVRTRRASRRPNWPRRVGHSETRRAHRGTSSPAGTTGRTEKRLPIRHGAKAARPLAQRVWETVIAALDHASAARGTRTDHRPRRAGLSRRRGRRAAGRAGRDRGPSALVSRRSRRQHVPPRLLRQRPGPARHRRTACPSRTTTWPIVSRQPASPLWQRRPA